MGRWASREAPSSRLLSQVHRRDPQSAPGCRLSPAEPPPLPSLPRGPTGSTRRKGSRHRLAPGLRRPSPPIPSPHLFPPFPTFPPSLPPLPRPQAQGTRTFPSSSSPSLPRGGPVSHPQPSPRYATHRTRPRQLPPHRSPSPGRTARPGPRRPEQSAPSCRPRGGGHVGGGGEQRRTAGGPQPRPGQQGALYRRQSLPGQCAVARRSPGAPPPLKEPAAPLFATPAPLRHTALPVGH